jgi:hypothetical protein
MDDIPTQPVPDDILLQLLEILFPTPRATSRDLRRAARNFNEFIYGDEYDPCPERRYVRAHGGHCSGGGGCS